jgi:trehalose synthase
MREVQLDGRNISAYEEFINEQTKRNLKTLSSALKGKKIAFVNSTSYGGGVAELFYSILPISRSLGVDLHWLVMDGDQQFFATTKKIHNMLQGKAGSLTSEEIQHYLDINRKNAEEVGENYDVIVIHDPQPMAMPLFLGKKAQHFIWRCHIDTSVPGSEAMALVQRFLPLYERTIFSLDSFAKGLNIGNSDIIHPSIDPLSIKNIPIAKEIAEGIVSKYGVDPHRPMIVQISRFDPWKDPLGVIDVYREVKRAFKDIQLVLVGSMATDDPEGWQFYQKTLRHAGEDKDLFILSNLDGVGSREVNAFQRIATVVLQKSIKEGFGLTVSEALWKKRAVIGGNVGGITVQIQHGVNGYLVHENSECVEDIIDLLNAENRRLEFGERGFETVANKFLITRHIEDYLRLFASMLDKASV